MPALSAARMPRCKGAELGEVQLTGRLLRMDARPPECLVGIDVPDARDAPLVEDRRLHRRAPVRECLAEALRRECRGQWLPAESRGQVRLDLVWLRQEPGSEAPDVAVHDVRTVV
jgi:hypothetical protein